MEAILIVLFSVLQVMLAVAGILVVAYLFLAGPLGYLWSVVTGAATALKRMAKRLFHLKGNHLRVEVPRVTIKVADKQD